ncbi:MAG: hypothetical protein KDD82_19965, partial [Planctomycetes bacterium]|nr:hypothetical protein [Planctomycetota bacterium]
MSSSSGDAGGELAERPEPSPETPSGGSVLRRGVILGLLLLVPLQLALPQVADPDLWWHLAAGRWIWAHGALPAHDPFSQHGADAPWAVYSWLFELALYGLYSLGGLLLIAVAHGLATTGIALGCLRLAHRFGRTWPETLGATAVACLTAGAVLTPRPWLCSIAFTLVLFELVFAARAGEGSRRLFAIPPLFALWANLHIQFVYGLLLLACFGLDALWERRAGRVEREYVRRLIAVGLLAGVATLLTPYHLR